MKAFISTVLAENRRHMERHLTASVAINESRRLQLFNRAGAVCLRFAVLPLPGPFYCPGDNRSISILSFSMMNAQAFLTRRVIFAQGLVCWPTSGINVQNLPFGVLPQFNKAPPKS